MGRAIGRGLVLGMPAFLKLLSARGTAARIWVGGGIIVHGLAELRACIYSATLSTRPAKAAARMLGPVAGAAEWVIVAALSGLAAPCLSGRSRFRSRGSSLRPRGKRFLEESMRWRAVRVPQALS